MNKQDILALFHTPYSSWGLRHRASKLHPGNPYPQLLLILADLEDQRKINEKKASVIVGDARSGLWDNVAYNLNAYYSIDELKKKFGITLSKRFTDYNQTGEK